MNKNSPSDDYTRHGPTYNPSTNTYTLSFDPDDPDCVLTSVVQAVAELSDTDPLQLEPLGSYIDMDELGRTIQLQQHGAVRIEQVTFPFEDHRVTITEDAEIHIEPPERSRPR